MYRICFFLMCLPLYTVGQSVTWDDFGGKIAVSFQFGSTVNRLGILVEGTFMQEYFQINSNIRWHYNFSSYGPPKRGNELVWKVGGVVGVGTSDLAPNPFTSSVSHQLQRKYSLGYSYNRYYDRIGTNQATGTISAQIGKLYFITENDAFAPPAADKFRTASAMFLYRITEDKMIALNTIMWTGDPFTNMIDTRVEHTGYPGRFGYRDISNATYGNYSHGIAALQYYHLGTYNQVLRYSMGIDWEYIRHFFQNKIIHDTYFLPEKWNRYRTPHIPMLDDKGNQFLFREGQRVKPLVPFAGFSMNPSWFY